MDEGKSAIEKSLDAFSQSIDKGLENEYRRGRKDALEWVIKWIDETERMDLYWSRSLIYDSVKEELEKNG